jgi:translation initiation factor IF-1
MEQEKTADVTVKAALRLSQVGRHDRALKLLEDAMIERPEEEDLLRAWRQIGRRVKKQLWRQRLWLLAPVVLTSLLIAVLVLSHHSTEVLLRLEAEGVGFDLTEPDLHVDNLFRTLGVTGAPLQTATVVHLDEIEVSAGQIEGAGRHLRLKLPSPQVPVDLVGVRATRLEVGPRKPTKAGTASRIDLVTEPTPDGAALTLLVRSPQVAGQLEIAGAGSLETGQPATAAGAAPGRTFRQLRFVPGSQGMDWIEFTRAEGQVQMQLGIPATAAGAGEELSVSSVSFVQRQSDPLSPQSMVRGGEIRFPDYRRDPIPLERGTFVLFEPGDRVRVQLSLDKGRLKADLRGRMRRLRVGMSAGEAVNVVPSTLLWIVEREKQTVVLYAIGVVLSVVYGFLQRMKLIHAD